MQNIFSKKTICLLFLFVSSFSFAQEYTEEHVDKSVKTEIKEYIDHHLLDSYDFSLTSYTTEDGEHKYIGFPLPVILWDNGLKVFSSSKLPFFFFLKSFLNFLLQSYITVNL